MGRAETEVAIIARVAPIRSDLEDGAKQALEGTSGMGSSDVGAATARAGSASEW